MKTFVDSQGRSWSIKLTFGTMEDVYDKLQIDLMQPEAGDTPLIDRIVQDERLLGKVIFALIGDQFDAQKLTEKEVKGSFDAETILRASDAFYAEWVDFFQKSGRNDRAVAVEKQRSMILAGIKVAESRLKRIDTEKRADEIGAEVDRVLGNMYTDKQENSESTPAR